MATTATRTLSNLPLPERTDSASTTLQYFNQYGESTFSFASGDVDAAAGFLKGKGFGNQAALITSAILLQQAKIENKPIYELLKTLEGLDSLQLSTVVGRILNDNRYPTSSLGFRLQAEPNSYQTRNIVP